MRKLLIPVAILAVVATACSVSLGTANTAPSQNVAPLSDSNPLPAGASVEAVVRRVLPAVVNVTTNIISSTGQQGEGVGTGFVVRSDGIVVTNCHVVEGASKITVSSSANTPKKYDARVIGGDCSHDLAVLKIDGSNLPTVALGNSSTLQLGQPVVALGYALALEGGPTVTTGVVSSLSRTIKVPDQNCPPSACQNGSRTYTDVVQTDAAINPGNSGGPLVNMQGEVVGINTAGDNQAQNIGFAIAIDSTKSTIAQAEASPLAPTGYMGVLTQSVTPDVALQFNLSVDKGAYIISTNAGGPAEKAGIQSGDVIVSIDGKTVSDSEGLGKILANYKPNDRISVEVMGKDGSLRTVTVTLGARPLPTTLP
jgi:S1-C subfamily serine protease